MYAPFGLLSLPGSREIAYPPGGTTIDLDISVAANLSNNPIADSLSGRIIARGSSRCRFKETGENKVSRSDRAAHHPWRLL